MKRASFYFFASIIASALACGDDTDGPGGSGGAGATTATTGGPATTGTMTTSSSTTTATTAAITSASNSASTGTGGADCPDIVCTVTCEFGFWDDLEGCDTCACAPPPIELRTNGFMHDTQHVAMTTEADMFIGGIDRWVFDFQWVYDDPQASDDQIVVTATVRLQTGVNPDWEPDEQNATWFSPENESNPIEMMGGDYTLYGFGVIMDTLTPVSGWLSIRRIGDTFEGGVFLDMQGNGSAGEVHASGPFSVPVP